MIRQAYERGVSTAKQHFKIANGAACTPNVGGSNMTPGQTSSTSMAMTIPKPATPPTAPVAGGAHKANVLG